MNKVTGVSLKIEINSYNAAMVDAHKEALTEILRTIIARIEAGVEGPYNIRDINGNKVGSWTLDIEGEDNGDADEKNDDNNDWNDE